MSNIDKSSVQRKYRLRGKGAETIVRQLNTKTGVIVDNYLLKVFEEQGFQFDPERDNRSVYEPSKLFDSLFLYHKRDIAPNREILKHAKAITLRAFGGRRELKPRELSEGLKPFIKLEKSSGLPMCDTKGAAFELDLRRAQECLSQDKPFPPCVAYHRIQFGEEGPKTRLVWGYPLSATLVEARFARPLIEHYLSSESPMAFGYRKIELSAVTQHLRNCGLVYCLDYSKFDSSIQSEFLGFAFDVLKTHFDLDEEEEIAWKRVVSYFIHTTILMPDGFVYQKHGGVPSGSYFTQMVDSIVNFLAVQYVSLRETNRGIPSGWLYVLGDDSIFTMPYLALSKIKLYASELGLTINDKKSVIARGSDEVHFLGHTWPNGVASRPIEDIIQRIVTSETPSKLPIPLQRSAKVMAFQADAREGSRIGPLVNKAISNRRRMYKHNLLIAAVPRNDRSYALTGSMKLLSVLGFKGHSLTRQQTLGLWLS